LFHTELPCDQFCAVVITSKNYVVITKVTDNLAPARIIQTLQLSLFKSLLYSCENDECLLALSIIDTFHIHKWADSTHATSHSFNKLTSTRASYMKWEDMWRG
jgi:hypothetical protein